MRVFLSWSGERSRYIAESLRGWLPRVIQAVRPWMSDVDIPAGARWQNDIAHELDKADFGIICVTPENIDKPWLMFEAGALSKSMKASRVCPLVYSLELSNLSGPVAQFQANLLDRDGLYQVLKAINTAMGENGLDENQLADQFEMLWGRIDKELKQIPPAKPAQLQRPSSPISDHDAEEMLKSLHRIVSKNNDHSLPIESSDPAPNPCLPNGDEALIPLRYYPISSLEGAIVGVSVVNPSRHDLRNLAESLATDLSTWKRAGINLPTVALTLTTEQLLSEELLSIIGDIGRDFPKTVEIEITEGQLAINLEKLRIVLSALSNAGFHIGVKEFGTGYSSLSSLRSLPINTLWIDHSFIKNIVIDKDDRNIAATIASLAASLGVVAIAEGVSTAEQSGVLLEIGVKTISGSMAGDEMSSLELFATLSA